MLLSQLLCNGIEVRTADIPMKVFSAQSRATCFIEQKIIQKETQN